MRTNLKRALTLIELVVVLLILVALASLVIPQLGGFLERTHAATSSDGINELSRVFQLNKTSTFREPDGFDSLLTAGTGGSITAGVSGTEGQTGQTTTGELSLQTLNAAQADAFNDAGITTVFDSADPAPGTSATFDLTFASRAVADGTDLLGLAAGAASDAIIQREFGQSAAVTGASYFVLGVGENSSLIGSRIVESPIHLGEENDPNREYSRFVAVYANDGSDVSFVGIAAVDDGGLKALRNHVAEYYEATNG